MVLKGYFFGLEQYMLDQKGAMFLCLHCCFIFMVAERFPISCLIFSQLCWAQVELFACEQDNTIEAACSCTLGKSDVLFSDSD